MIRLGTLFSGIGAIEQTFLKMKLSHEIVFACDNGERVIKMSQEKLNEHLLHFTEDEIESEIVRLYDQTGKPNFMEISYKENYEIKSERFFQDIRFLKGNKFRGNVDIVVGGSPCQAFSCNGKRGGFEDTRGTLFFEYARVIKESQPKCFIFENVRGVLNHDNGKTWLTIKNVFRDMNYNIYLHHDSYGNEDPVVNAADYGIPQLRMRIYVIGIRNDIKLINDFSFPKRMELRTTVNDFLLPNVDAKYYLAKKGFEFVTTHPSRAQVGLEIMTCQKANQQFNWNGTFIFEPLDETKHTRDILNKAYIGEWKGQKGVVRMFTPRECLRLMGFPDTFKIVVNDNIMWRQAGNSIVVNVLEAIMNEIIRTGVFDA